MVEDQEMEFEMLGQAKMRKLCNREKNTKIYLKDELLKIFIEIQFIMKSIEVFASKNLGQFYL